MHAKGEFEVKLAPLPVYDQDAGAVLARLSLDKTFHGGLEATSKGEMLSAGTPQSGSAGYVAIERVTGALQGKRGSFVLQHHAIMDGGKAELHVRVVPGSGTGELAGLAGTMAIIIAEGQHAYEFEYQRVS